MHQNIESNNTNQQRKSETSHPLNLRKKQMDYQKEEASCRKRLTEIRKNTIKLLKLKPISNNKESQQEKENNDRDDDYMEDERDDLKHRTFSVFQRYNTARNNYNFERMKYMSAVHEKFNDK